MFSRVMDSSSSSSDLPLKHQRLLAEYARVRAQVVVLKKAVTEEQSKNEEFKLKVNSQDQSNRKLEQEVECLHFRNQQLERRVAVLQNDLEQIKSPKVKGNKNQVHDERFDGQFAVLNAELSCKIEENKDLHMKLNSLESRHDQEVNELKSQFSKYKCESAGLIQEQNEKIESLKEEINSLNQCKTRAENKAVHLEEQLNKASIVIQKFFGTSIDEVNELGLQDAEDEMTCHLKKRITELLDGYHAADSKAVLFLSEANRLKQRLTIAAEEKKSMLDELTESKQLIGKLRDDLTTTVRNYESQLMAMSDHLANESEKWSQQQLELDTLKDQMNNHANNWKSKK